MQHNVSPWDWAIVCELQDVERTLLATSTSLNMVASRYQQSKAPITRAVPFHSLSRKLGNMSQMLAQAQRSDNEYHRWEVARQPFLGGLWITRQGYEESHYRDCIWKQTLRSNSPNCISFYKLKMTILNANTKSKTHPKEKW